MTKQPDLENNKDSEITTPEGSRVEGEDGPKANPAEDLNSAGSEDGYEHLTNINVRVGDNIFSHGKFFDQERKELSKLEDPGLISDIAYDFERNEIEEKYSLLIDNRILVIHSLDYSVLSYYANVICRMALDKDKNRQVRSLAIEKGTGTDDEITLRDYEKRFLNSDEVSGAQILLITDRNDYESHESLSFFQSMMDESHGAENFRNRLLKNDHLIIYKFGGFATWQFYKANLNKWNFGDIWNISFFPTALFVKYFPLHDKASDYESKIRQQRKEGKWHKDERAFLKELSIALKTNRLDQAIREKADKDYKLPSSEELNIEVQDLIERHSLNPFVLLVAAFFGDLNLGEFNDILTLLLKRQDSLTFKGDNKKIFTKKSLLVQWQMDGDKVIRNCALEYSGTNLSIERVRFIDSQIRNKIREYFNSHYAFFQLRQAEVLINSDYWLDQDFNDNNIKNFTSLVSHIAANNRQMLVKSFLSRVLVNLEKERRNYVVALNKTMVIQSHLNRTKSKLDNEDLSYDDLFAGLNDLQQTGDISEEEIRRIYFKLIYGGINLNKNSSDQEHNKEYRRVLQKSFENGEANKERFILDQQKAANAYFLILYRVIDYLTSLMKRASLKEFVLNCLKEEISRETFTVSGLALVSTLHKEHQEDSLDILESFLESHRKQLREQSFQALVNLIRRNTATLSRVGNWRPSAETTVMGMKDVSWLENSAVAVAIDVFRDGIESIDFIKDDGSEGRIYQLGNVIHQQREKWGGKRVPLAIFASLLDTPGKWQSQLVTLLDWLFNPLTPAADLRRRERGHYTQHDYQEHQKSILYEISWMINLWSQVLLDQDLNEADQPNSEIVKYILTYISKHENKSISKLLRSFLGQQPGLYSDYIIYLKKNKSKYKTYIEQRTFVRNLIKQFEELRQEADQVVQS